MESRIEQSDYILCKNIQNLHFKHKRESDLPYMSLLSKPLPCCIRDVSEEYQMWTDSYATRNPYCNESIVTRGGNNKKGGKTQVCRGYECLKGPYSHNFLLTPCTQNTFQNYLVEDNNKICSVNHQLFNNMTRRI